MPSTAYDVPSSLTSPSQRPVCHMFVLSYISRLCLRSVGERIRANLRRGDTVARMSGDEFAILLTRIDEDAGIDRVAHLERSFNNRLAIWGRKPWVTAVVLVTKPRRVRAASRRRYGSATS